jgi:hypothetical protein
MPHPLSPDRPRNRLAYLFLFLAANSLIAFSGFSPAVKIAVGLFGLALPLTIAFHTANAIPKSQAPVYAAPSDPSPPLWAWACLWVVLVLTRFWGLTNLFAWPNLDEAWNGTLALELSRKWTWKFFYTFGETPPLSIWFTAALFKLGFSPAFSLWFPSALVSILTVVAGTLAARQFFAKSFAFLCACLLTLGYWPLYIGRLCHEGIWLPLWVCLCLYFTGRFLKAPAGNAQKFCAAALGLCLGLGSFTFTPWPVVSLVFILTVLFVTYRTKRNWPVFLLLLAAFFIALAPFFIAISREGFGRHIVELSPWGGWFHSFNFFAGFGRYFSALLWSPFEQDPAYTPVWGGFLNPLLGAFFWWGCIEMARLRRQRLAQWTSVAFILFLLPGGFSPNVEMFRVAQILPLLLWMVALGIQSFLSAWPKRRIMLLCLILIPSVFFDVTTLFAPYQNPNRHPQDFGRPLKSLERYNAFQALEKTAREKGPGLVFAAFDTDALNDPSLKLMSYPFDLAQNKKLQIEIINPIAPFVPVGKCKWMAVFVNENFEPFLKKRFPEGQWNRLSGGPPTGYGGNLLGIIPITKNTAQTAGTWATLNFIMDRADQERFFQNYGLLENPLKIMKTALPWSWFQGDPFLESVFWDKVAAYEYVNLDYPAHLKAYENAVSRGYPTAALYFKLGLLHLAKQNIPEAQTALQRATQAPLDLTSAKTLLEELNRETAAEPSGKHSTSQ